MTELYRRILTWHKLVAQVTGGLALCSARHKLNRTEALAWADGLRDVSDEIRSVVETGAFILDDKGRRVVGSKVDGPCSDGGATPPAVEAVPANTVVPGSSNPERGPSALRRVRRK